jgi:hypothetical protein
MKKVAWSPNPRLQRTRLRALGATARPLSRKPLDGRSDD